MPQRSFALSIVLPAYKEKENLAVLVPQIEEEFAEDQIEIIVVDDNSEDGTRELVRELDKKYGNVALLERPGLLGIGSALRDGYNMAQGEYILSSDADLSFVPGDMRRIWDEVRTDYDLVLGYRVRAEDEKRKKKTLHGWSEDVIISPLSNLIIRVMSGMKLRNYNTNFRVIRARTWQRIRTVENRQFFLFEMIFRAKQEGARIGEIPVTFRTRTFGESKVNFFKQAPKYFMKLLKYTFFDR